MSEPTISVDSVSEVLRSSATDGEKLRRLQRLVDDALRPKAPPAPLERDPGGWPRLRASKGGADTGNMFWFPPYDPRD